MQLINFHPIFNIISNMHNSIYGSCLMSYSPVIGGSNPRKGDLLVIVGATLYAISNVSEVSWLYFCFKAFCNNWAVDSIAQENKNIYSLITIENIDCYSKGVLSVLNVNSYLVFHMPAYISVSVCVIFILLLLFLLHCRNFLWKMLIELSLWQC